MINSNKLQPILKWAGGKEKELKYIIPNIPATFERYYEPFVGGGSVYTAMQCNYCYINDKSHELISLYRIIASPERCIFFSAVEEITHNWELLTDIVENNKDFFISTYKVYSTNQISDIKFKDILFEFILSHSTQFNGMFSTIFNFNIENFINEIKINIIRKTKRMKVLEVEKHQPLPDADILDNIETALKSAYYMHFRHLYNNIALYSIGATFQVAIFLFIRNFAYSGMFRYNSRGEFNVPYGGIGYNRKNFRKKLEYLKSAPLSELLGRTTVESLDFEDFLELHQPSERDFMFLDPPYDSEFSTYSQNPFTQNDQRRLADFLINRTPAKWMMIIKNTEFIMELYNNNGLNIRSFDKKYLVSFMNRNDKNVEHLLITNY